MAQFLSSWGNVELHNYSNWKEKVEISYKMIIRTIKMTHAIAYTLNFSKQDITHERSFWQYCLKCFCFTVKLIVIYNDCNVSSHHCNNIL